MWRQRSPLPALGECLGQELPVWQRLTAGSVVGRLSSLCAPAQVAGSPLPLGTQRQGHARGRARAQSQADARAGFFPPHLCLLLPGDLLCPHALRCLGQREEPQGTYRPPRAVLSTVLAVTTRFCEFNYRK